MNSETKQINACEVCNSTKLEKVLDLGLHPMCDDLVKFQEKKICKEYPIEILFCNKCKTAHQKYQIKKESLFPGNYHYRARFTKDVIDGMKSLVKSSSSYFLDKTNRYVLDIGCNDGSLLNLYREIGYKTIGIEPTGAFKDCQKNGHDVYNEYLSEKLATKIVSKYGHPDLVTFTNVFAHIDDLKQVLRSLKILMHENTILIIENHYLGSVLKKNQFDTFYHEHPRTYSLSSFKYIASSLNSKVIKNKFPSRYGGNIQVFISKNGVESENLEKDISNEKDFSIQFKKLNENVQKWIKNKSNQISQATFNNEKLVAKAFPGRASILVKLLKLDDNKIEAVYEKPGSLKIGNYLPGTRIPIVSDDELFKKIESTSLILNLAWHIPDEISKYLTNKKYKGKILNIIDRSDFN